MSSLKYISGEPNLQTVTLASDYTASDGHMHLTAGHGARLPATGDFWIRTPATGDVTNIFKVTARSTDDLTVVAVTGYGADGNHAAGTVFSWTFCGEALDQLKADLLPTRVDMWHDASLVTVGNALAVYIYSGAAYGFFCYQNTPADGDTFTQSFLLAAGTYTLWVMGSTNADRGKIDWYIDDVKVVSLQDWYSAAEVKNVIKTATSITVSGNGRHVLKGVTNGKTGSGYSITIVKISLIPTSDVGSV